MSACVRAGFVGAVAAALLSISPTIASAATFTNHAVAGIQYRASCLTAQVCVVAGYSERSIGDVVAVRNGVPGHVSIVAVTQGIDDVSCPNATGCIALERTGNDVGTGFVSINSAGVVTHAVKVATPAGVTLGRISCTSLKNCEVAGSDFFTSPPAIEVGTWNGTKLVLHRVSTVPKATATIVEGLKCVGATCLVVGYVNHGSSNVGFALSVVGGTKFKLRTVGNDSLYGVSCATQVRCFAVGFNAAGGVIVSLTGGAATSSVSTKPDLYGIACVGFACTAVGEELPPPPSTDADWGAVLSVIGGSVTSTQLVPQSLGYEGVARVGGVFTAVGAGHGLTSEITAG
jgi:hypothetical protein